jgi:hypothetical protein
MAGGEPPAICAVRADVDLVTDLTPCGHTMTFCLDHGTSVHGSEGEANFVFEAA